MPLNHSIETSSRHLAIGPWQLLCSIEFVFKIDKLFGRLVVEKSTIIEAANPILGVGSSGK